MSICKDCFHSYVCEQFNEHRESDNKKCHFFNDHFVRAEDVVKVVRCKDCQIGKSDLFLEGYIYCCNNGLTHRADHFCSYGELKEREKV